MKKAYEVLPFYKNDVSVSKKVQFGELEKFPNGKQAQDFLLRCEDGIPAIEFDELAKSPDMTRGRGSHLSDTVRKVRYPRVRHQWWGCSGEAKERFDLFFGNELQRDRCGDSWRGNVDK